MNVQSVNDAPVANADSATTDEDTAVNVSVLANDTDVDGDNLAVSGVTNGTHGNGDGKRQQHDHLHSWLPTILVRIRSPTPSPMVMVDQQTGTVTVNVQSVNDAPVANADSATTDEDTAVNVSVLANDTDVDGDNLAVSGVTNGTHGTATANANNTITYTPGANYFGPDTFTYTVSDGHGGTASGTVNVTVQSVNDAPVANADSATTNGRQCGDRRGACQRYRC